MRRLLAIGSASILLLAACGDDDESSVESSASSVAPTEAPADSAPPAAAGAAITPVALCYSNPDETTDYAFGYVNESTTAVVLDAGASTVTGTEDADLPFVPVVFAPGEVSPALWLTNSADGEFPSWSITGPDGETRTATADDSLEQCGFEPEDSGDPRTPLIEITEVAAGADGTTATFVSSLTGVDTSNCPSGLENLAPVISWDDGAGGNVTEGPTAEWTVELNTPVGGGDGRLGFARVAALVIDQCGAGDAVQPIWPGGVFEALYTGVLVCIDESGGELVALTSQDEGDCFGPPPTGGTRSRPG